MAHQFSYSLQLIAPIHFFLTLVDPTACKSLAVCYTSLLSGDELKDPSNKTISAFAYHMAIFITDKRVQFRLKIKVATISGSCQHLMPMNGHLLYSNSVKVASLSHFFHFATLAIIHTSPALDLVSAALWRLHAPGKEQL